jgi:hypothetical protein
MGIVRLLAQQQPGNMIRLNSTLAEQAPAAPLGKLPIGDWVRSLASTCSDKA